MATINQIDCYVPSTSILFNFTLSYNNESPTGEFIPIGTFTPYQGFIKAKPFQDFPFDPIKVKYLKFSGDSGRCYEFRLWGVLE